MNATATIANSLWIGSSLPGWRRFRAALNRPDAIQQNLLHQLIRINAESAFGRLHHFSEINNYTQFVRNVPILNYEDLAPWITRIQNGEQGVLTQGKVTHLIPTSGSTGGRKLIPFTKALQNEFNRGVAPWIVDLAREHPDIIFGPSYWCITPPAQSLEAEGSTVPIGFDDDISYLGSIKSRVVRAAIVAPVEISGVFDFADFRFRTLTALLRPRDLRLFSVWHPSFLTLLLDALPGCWDKILSNFRSTSYNRLRELEKADPLRPETFWPRLRVISCWGDGQAAIPLAGLRRRFKDVFVQAKGLLATEAFVTIPFAGTHPVAVCSHFFEFLDDKGYPHLLHELREGEAYEVVVSTSGGLWRYRLNDLIQVTGFVGKTPALRFLGRCGNVSDQSGEKLSEDFVANSVNEILERFGLKPNFAFLAPNRDSTGLYYTLYVEGEASGQIGESLDFALCQNPHYRICRNLGQLLPVRIFRIAEKGFEIFVKRQADAGIRVGDIKPAALSRLSGWSDIFPGDYV